MVLKKPGETHEIMLGTPVTPPAWLISSGHSRGPTQDGPAKMDNAAYAVCNGCPAG